MTINTIAWISLVCALLPALLFLVNLWVYRRLSKTKPHSSRTNQTSESLPALSVLIPARNEAAHIQTTLAAVCGNTGVDYEVLVLDDHSTDSTAALVTEVAAQDNRVHLLSAPPLPTGWCGKQHACAVLAQHARNPILVFIDADVRLAPDALWRIAAYFHRGGAPLLSGVPLQEMRAFSERLLLPFIHFLLLGFLPIPFMRLWKGRAFGAGCGQFFAIRATAYHACGGHSQIPTSLHDGLTLPKAFRAAGFRTDLCDASDLAVCRMYSHNAAVWQGLAKNATEGLAAPGVILPMTLLLLGGQVLPWVLLFFNTALSGTGLAATFSALSAAYLPRLIAVWRFRQPLDSALLHPLGMMALLAIQWFAFVRQLAGRPSTWKDRTYASSAVQASMNPPPRLKKPFKSWRQRFLRAAPLFSLVLTMMMASVSGAAGSAVTPKTVVNFSLQDQFNQNHHVQFPARKTRVLTVADKKGSEQIESWIKPIKERYHERLELIGVADVRRVPRPLRSLVQRSFKKQMAYPILLDWNGTVPETLASSKNQANIYIISPDGRILIHKTGLATESGLAEICQAIEHSLQNSHESQ